MLSFFRSCGMFLAGLAVAFAGVMAVEIASNAVHPFPADCKYTHEEVCAHVTRYPQWILAVAAGLWAGIAWGSTWITARWGSVIAGGLLGALLFAAVVFNLSMLPYPMWFKGANGVLIPVAICGALWSASRGIPPALPPVKAV